MPSYNALAGRHKWADNINASRTYHCAIDSNGNVPKSNYLAGKVLVLSSSKDGGTGTNTNFVNIGNGVFVGISMGLDSYRDEAMLGVDNPDISVITASHSVVVEVDSSYTPEKGDIVSYNEKGLLVRADTVGNDIIGTVESTKTIGLRVDENGKVANNVHCAVVRLEITRRFGLPATNPTPTTARSKKDKKADTNSATQTDDANSATQTDDANSALQQFYNLK